MKLIVLWSVTLYVVQACNSLAYTLAQACPTIPCIHLVIIILSQFQLKRMDEGPPPNAVVDELGVLKPYQRNNRVSVLATYVWSSLDPRPNPRGRVWGITLLGSVLMDCRVSQIQPTSSFRSSTRLVRHYSNFQNFYVLPYIRFPSLVPTRTLVG